MADGPWGASSGTVATYDGGLGRVQNVAPSATETLNCPLGTTKVDIVYCDYAAGTWTYTVDGGSAVTVTNTGYAIGLVQLKKVTITGLSAGSTHTIVIGGASAGLSSMLSGATCYTGTNGIGFARLAFPSMTATAWITPAGSTTSQQLASSFPDNKDALLAGLSTAQFSGFPLQPSLAIVGLGANDAGWATHPDIFRLALVRLINALRRGTDNCSIMFVAYSQSGGIVNDDGAYGKPGLLPRYKSIIRSTAAEYRCAFVDVDSKWGQTALTKGFRLTTDIHPTAAGHTDIKNLIMGVI